MNKITGNKKTLTSYEIQRIINSQYHNVVTQCIESALKSGWILESDIEYIEAHPRRKYFMLNSDDALKIIFQLRPRLAYFLYQSKGA